MSTLQLNKPVPNFSAPVTGNHATFTLADLKGKHLILYFYPKDNTAGCTTEGQNFRDHSPAFLKANTVVYGISRDSLKSHEKFKQTQQFPFELISDADEHLCKLFDVLKPKKLYGKEYIGIERSTFLIDKEGILRQEWRKVKVEGHVQAVLDAVNSLT